MLVKIRFAKSSLDDLEYELEPTTTLQEINNRITGVDRREYFENNPHSILYFIYRSRIWNDKTITLEQMGIQDGMSIIGFVKTEIVERLNPPPPVEPADRYIDNATTNITNNTNNTDDINSLNNFTERLNMLLGIGTNGLNTVSGGVGGDVNVQPLNNNQSLLNNNPFLNILNTFGFGGSNILNNTSEFPPLNSNNQTNNQVNNYNIRPNQIREMRDMGFNQSDEVIMNALHRTNGNVILAIDILLGEI